MLVALRGFSIGEHEFGPGERIPQEVQSLLPPRRVEQLKSQRLAEEITDEKLLSEALEDVIEDVEKLKAELAKLTKPTRAKTRRAA